MKITEYDSGAGKCVSCGKNTLHTVQVKENVRMRICRKCDRRIGKALIDGVLMVDDGRKVKGMF
jgi:NMD protein affecting ribosome stability and mRNA decay